jgi:hypothetical protein
LLLLYRYLATGDSFRSVAFCFRVGASTAAGIVNEVCAAIWNSLLADYMPMSDAAEWRKIAAVQGQNLIKIALARPAPCS